MPNAADPRKKNRIGLPVGLVLLLAVFLLWRSSGGLFRETQGKEQTVAFTVETLTELRDSLPQTCGGDVVDVTFCYTGFTPPESQDIPKMLGAHKTSLTDLGDGYYRITAYPYPGDRMLAAHRSGDRSRLTAEEASALDLALQVVEQARQAGENQIQRLLYLHDWLLQHITYFDFDFSTTHTEYRQLTAVGALLDGSANCQGYTDAFYLLGNLAGFSVDRQSTDTHIFNTIQLDGAWYIMDVTFNDQDSMESQQVSSEGYSNYRLFNAGLDHCADHVWEAHWQRHPISPVSGAYYYYNLTRDAGPAHSYEKTFSDLDTLAKRMIAALQTGRKDQCALLLGREADWKALGDALNRAAGQAGMCFSGAIATVNQNGNTYYFVRFA